MSNYHQPKFYRFNEDSIKLARIAANSIYDTSVENLSILDLGAGCGVVGLELARILRRKLDLHLCEVQSDYQNSLQENVKALQAEMNDVTCQISMTSWCDFHFSKFDLIICNPPYFLIGQGREGNDQRREKARRWSKQERDQFFLKVLDLCSTHTRIAVCLRERPPEFFMDQVLTLREELLNEREGILTFGFVFALNIQTDK